MALGQVLADPVRLRLLSLIASVPAGEACVCELVAPLERSQPTASHHLKILADARLIVGEKRAAGSDMGLCPTASGASETRWTSAATANFGPLR